MSCTCTCKPPPPDHSQILEKLTGFLTPFAPAIGEVRPLYDVELADSSASFEVVGSRNLAIVAAFQAVERIARATAR
jgi:hypothetical protein